MRRTIIRYVLLAVIVAVLGALTGWYLYIRGQTQAVSSADQSRGFNTGLPAAPAEGNTYANAYGSATATVPHGPLPRLWHVSKTPVSGYAFADSGTSTVLTFVDRGSGYVLSADPSTQQVQRITNTLMPKTYNAIISGDKVIERSVSTNGITTFAGAIATSSSNSATVHALKGTALEPNIETISIDPASNRMFYIAPTQTGAAGYERAWGSGARTQVFGSAIRDWKSWSLADGRTILLEKPADDVLGYAYVLGKDGALERLVAPAPGLTILPKSGSDALIWGSSQNGTLSLYARTSMTNEHTLPVQTIADKCTWAPGASLNAYCGVPQTEPTGTFLDDWYKGETHTADALWEVSATGTARVLYTPANNVVLDISHPTVDPTGKYIAFQNARDDSLWLLRLAQ